MVKHSGFLVFALLLGALILVGCNINPQPANLTPIPKLAPASTVTLLPELSGSGSTSGPVVPGQAGSAATGGAIFEQNCTPCHGNQGEGVSAPALRNNSFVQGGIDPVVGVITNGRGEMPAWAIAKGGPLTPGNIADVAAFVTSLQKVPDLPKATEQPPAPTEAPPAADAEPAKPSFAGGPGPAASLAGDANRGMPAFGQFCASCHGPQGKLGQPNPDSDDGSVPALNPIDPTLINKDPKVFAQNLDLFIEHGSIPSGAAPWIAMPAFGDQKIIPDQLIADIIAYVMQLNQQK